MAGGDKQATERLMNPSVALAEDDFELLTPLLPPPKFWGVSSFLIYAVQHRG